MDEKKVVTPVQPYLRLDAEDYKEILNKRMGISSFYEFQVKDPAQSCFKASSPCWTRVSWQRAENRVSARRVSSEV